MFSVHHVTGACHEPAPSPEPAPTVPTAACLHPANVPTGPVPPISQRSRTDLLTLADIAPCCATDPKYHRRCATYSHTSASHRPCRRALVRAKDLGQWAVRFF